MSSSYIFFVSNDFECSYLYLLLLLLLLKQVIHMLWYLISRIFTQISSSSLASKHGPNYVYWLLNACQLCYSFLSELFLYLICPLDNFSVLLQFIIKSIIMLCESNFLDPSSVLEHIYILIDVNRFCELFSFLQL